MAIIGSPASSASDRAPRPAAILITAARELSTPLPVGLKWNGLSASTLFPREAIVCECLELAQHLRLQPTWHRDPAAHIEPLRASSDEPCARILSTRSCQALSSVAAS